MELFSSTIIPTVNRPSLACAVRSVLEQAFTVADFEVIVVNDSGQPLPDADWQHSKRVRVIDTNRRERSVARNTGAAIARGKYLHFLDDDDVLLPGALQVFWNLGCEHPNAAWLYGSYQTVDNEGNLIFEFHPQIQNNIFPLLVSGEAIPFQTSLVQTKYFYAVGGFDPTITGVEDRDLGRRIAFRGTVAYAPTVVAKIRIGERGSTTNWNILAEDDRWGREKALSMQGAFTRLWTAAVSSYWHGRVSRAYVASMVWNLQRKHIFIATGRALAALVFAHWHIFTPGFWKGLRTKIN